MSGISVKELTRPSFVYRDPKRKTQIMLGVNAVVEYQFGVASGNHRPAVAEQCNFDMQEHVAARRSGACIQGAFVGSVVPYRHGFAEEVGVAA